MDSTTVMLNFAMVPYGAGSFQKGCAFLYLASQ